MKTKLSIRKKREPHLAMIAMEKLYREALEKDEKFSVLKGLKDSMKKLSGQMATGSRQ